MVVGNAAAYMMVVMLVVVEEEAFVWMCFFGALWQNRSKGSSFCGEADVATCFTGLRWRRVEGGACSGVQRLLTCSAWRGGCLKLISLLLSLTHPSFVLTLSSQPL